MMRWVFKRVGSHAHVTVYINGACAGRLCFKWEEFEALGKQTMAVGLNDDEIGLVVKIEERKSRQA